MSVLNQSVDEPVECPLCMEQLEVDDLNFYPCTCGYQICRFCWHRIRTDENGLCPACRKAYPENPADFRPLTTAEVQRLKSEKRLREQQRKQKVTESRQHLASVRVVQRNLVFVVGLPMRLADSEVLKKHEYFGKFGKIHKVVINQSTSYAGSQGPSASAYVTYQRAEDTLRAIAAVNNITVDGRTLKASLGTTKYCSHFMKNQPCPKTECMYLHDLGDPEASFTKEDMQQGKHQEYEKKLHEQLLNSTASQLKENNDNNNKEVWPSLQGGGCGRDEEEEDEVGSPPLQQSKPTRQTHKSESSATSANLLNGSAGGAGGGSSVQGNHKKRHTSGEEPRGRRRGRDKGQNHQHSNNNNNATARGQQQQSGIGAVNGQKRQRHGASVIAAASAVATTIAAAEEDTEDASKLDGVEEQSSSPPQSSSPSSSTSSLSGSTPLLNASTSNLAPPHSSSSPPLPSSRSLSTSSSDYSSTSSISEDAQQPSAIATQDALTDVHRRAAIFAAASGREEQDNQSFFSSSTHQFMSRSNIENGVQWDQPQSRQGSNASPSAHSPTSMPAACATPPLLIHTQQQQQPQLPENLLHMRSATDWQVAFGFGPNHKPLPAMQNNRMGGSNNSSVQVEDELGFDPFVETQKALAEMIETEQQQNHCVPSYHHYQQHTHQQLNQQQHQQHQMNHMSQPPPQLIQQQQQHYPTPPPHLQAFRSAADSLGSRVSMGQSAASRLMEAFSSHSATGPPPPHVSRPPPPPGFSNTSPNNHMSLFGLGGNAPVQQTSSQQPASKILPFMNLQQQHQQQQIQQQQQHSSHVLSQIRVPGAKESKEGSSFSLADWHAILPNLGTGSSPSYSHSNGGPSHHRQPPPRTAHKDWQNDWTAMDPAIVAATPLMSVSSGGELSPSSNSGSSLFPWVKSLEPLSVPMYQQNSPHSNHNIASGWPVMAPSLSAATAAPPPGFSHQMRRGPPPTLERPTIENL